MTANRLSRIFIGSTLEADKITAWINDVNQNEVVVEVKDQFEIRNYIYMYLLFHDEHVLAEYILKVE